MNSFPPTRFSLKSNKTNIHPPPPAKESHKHYLALKQPPYRPPPQVFGPAWTLLYGLMGYSAYRAYTVGMSPFASAEHQLMTKHGATLYTVQLGLNLIWMPLFFWAKRPIEATVDIVALTGKLYTYFLSLSLSLPPCS